MPELLGTSRGLDAVGESPAGFARESSPARSGPIVFSDQMLDCSFVGNAIRVPCGGLDRFNVEAEAVSAAWNTAVLRITTAAGESSRGDVPSGGQEITSTASTQSQPGLDITAKGEIRVEVVTIDAGFLARIRVSAMKI